MFFISQTSTSDCAFTCLKILLANYHHDKNYLFLPCKDSPYSFDDLKKVATQYEMNVVGIKVSDYRELKQSKELPFIITLNKKKGVKHSVLLLSISRRHAKIFDPEVGKRKIPLEELYSFWDGKALIIEKELHHQKRKCPERFTDFIDKKDKITLPVWQLLSGVSLLFGVYFINRESYFYIPIIFFALFLIFEILFRKNLISALKRMDDNFFSYELIAPKEKYFDVYKVLEKYRYTALTIIPNVIYSLMISIFVIAVLIMNGYLNIIYIAIALAIAIIHVFIYKPYFKVKSNEIAEQENDIHEVVNQFQFKASVDKAHQAAYQVALSNNFINYIEIAVLLMSSITIMTLSGVVNVVYIVFYLCVSIYLKDNFIKMFEYSSQSEDFDNYLAKLIQFVDLRKNNSIE